MPDIVLSYIKKPFTSANPLSERDRCPEKAQSRKVTGLDRETRAQHLPSDRLREKYERALGKASWDLGRSANSQGKSTALAARVVGHAHHGYADAVSATRGTLHYADGARSVGKSVVQMNRAWDYQRQMDARGMETADSVISAPVRDEFINGLLAKPTKSVKQVTKPSVIQGRLRRLWIGPSVKARWRRFWHRWNSVSLLSYPL